VGAVGATRETALSEFGRLMRRRKMTREFRSERIAPDLITEILDAARRVPTAGNSQGLEFLVLDEPDAVERYWSTTFSESGRASFRWQGLFDAPVLISVYGDPDAYTDRYSEPDKTHAGLSSADGWTTPYWLVDASMAALAVQLGAIDAGLGVLLFGQFDHAGSVAKEFGVPEHMVTTGTIALGWPAESATRADPGSAETTAQPGLSSSRPRRNLESMVHKNRWPVA